MSATIRIASIRRGAALRLKSWQPAVPVAVAANPLAPVVAVGGPLAPAVAAGEPLPSEVGTMLCGSTRILCLGPDEWLVLATESDAAAVRAQLEAQLASTSHALVDLSDGLAALEVQGGAARELLSKGCGLDLHPRSFPEGRCARTRFAQIPVVIECLDDSPRFELTVQRSYLQYLHGWLADAAIEFDRA
jgi:sarcosine oxidase, subunit gamma